MLYKAKLESLLLSYGFQYLDLSSITQYSNADIIRSLIKVQFFVVMEHGFASLSPQRQLLVVGLMQSIN